MNDTYVKNSDRSKDMTQNALIDTLKIDIGVSENFKK